MGKGEFLELKIDNNKLLTTSIISRLKSIRRFNLVNYREGEYGIDTEREYDGNGDYIDSYEIDELISELERLNNLTI
jgi:hypothetical protein